MRCSPTPPRDSSTIRQDILVRELQPNRLIRADSPKKISSTSLEASEGEDRVVPVASRTYSRISSAEEIPDKPKGMTFRPVQ